MRIAVPGIAVLALILTGSPARAQQPAGPFEALACAPAEMNTAAALAGDFVHVTRDGGATWTRVFIGVLRTDDARDEAAEAAGEDWDETSPEDDGEDSEDEADEVEPEWLDGPAREQSTEEGDTTRPLLAVADDGRLAVTRGGTLLIGGATARREIGLPPAARGLRFDGAGNLWIAADSRLVRVEPDGGWWEVLAAVAGV
ncbi:MAG TPA: hypothetical protein VM285_12670, partial [Polyangia bacterium]|nr:hypothetical protein [Polyangia bacterium]